MVHIPEIELNFCNVCGARCYLCSYAHGRGGVAFMSDRVFLQVVRELRRVSFDTVQTSGNGDCWLHPRFLDWLRILRQEFPRAEIVNYSSFALFTPDRIEQVLSEHLLTRQHTRVDSLDPAVFAKATNLNPETVFRHIDCYLACTAQHDSTPLHIGYSSISAYYRLCRRITGHAPFHGPFNEEEVEWLPDEFEAVKRRFPRAIVSRIRQSLWGEREDPRTPPDPTGACPKTELLKRILWISPDGTANACGQDDEQSNFVYGNVLEESIEDLWTGKARQDILERLRTRKVTGYPCNPACCTMRAYDEA